jgi:hypothetical protein
VPAGVFQQAARDLVPNEIVFVGEVDGMVEYDFEYSVLTTAPDGPHTTSIQVLINDIPYETVPLEIEPAEGRTGCYGYSSLCQVRTCIPASVKCVGTIGGICACNYLGGIFGRSAPLEPGDILTMVMDPENVVPEEYEENNTLAVVYEFEEVPTVSAWGLVVTALLLLAAGKVYFGYRQPATAQ